MRKTYMMLLALVLSVMGATSAMAQKVYRAELDKSMFKAWDGYGANANEVANPAAIDDGAATFGCEFNLYKELGAGSVVYGNTNVYYLWYANLTGTQKLVIEGTAGMQLRILLNRPEPDGGDAHGGATTELNVTLDDSGKGEVDLSSLEFVHLNCIKTGWGSPAGVINVLEIIGSVRPVSGYLDLISNGDAEGDDLESFPVSHDGPNNGNTANDRPEIVAGAGVDGSRCFKVVSDNNASETWSTQFYLKFDEALQEGDKWKLSMYIKADRDAQITTSAQAQPRTWNGGFLEEFSVTTEWQKFDFSGTVEAGQANNGGFLSAAFDLNNDKDVANTFYFDNIVFQKDMGGANPMSLVTGTVGGDVVRLDLAGTTNMKKLVAAAGGKTLFFPTENASVVLNGKEIPLVSVEGRPDGNLYLFMLEDEAYEEDVVVVAFKNPADAEHHLVFETGKWQGEDVPEMSGLICSYDFDLGSGEYSSSLWGAPEVESAIPEIGSFNLDPSLNEFKIIFNQKVKVASIKATLGNEVLTASAAEEFAKEVTLTRNGGTIMGAVELIISAVEGEKSTEDLDEPIVINYSFGPVNIDPNDQPKDMLDLAAWNATGGNGIPAGYKVLFGEEERTSENTYGSGSRMFTFPESGDFTHGLYFREGYVLYGDTEGFELPLEAGKKYNIHFNSARWKSNGAQMTFQILSADDPETALFEQVIDNDPDVNGNTGNAVNGSTNTDLSFIPETTGNYLLKWISNGFIEVLLANPTVKYVPNTLGVEETVMLETALTSAKEALEANSDERYNGAAYDALNAAINQYESEKAGYTAPSQFKNAVAALGNATQAMSDHRKLCDTYDPLPEQAQEILNNNAGKKFETTDIYVTLKSVTAKYAIVSQETSFDEETGEEITLTVVKAKPIKDDAELNAAVSELQTNIDLANGMFTEGPSKIGDWSSTRTGYAPLVDRIRQGAEALKSLGVSDDNELIVAANKALSDDDQLAESIKTAVKIQLYALLKDKDIFEPAVDPETGEEGDAPVYNMTVFVKNPNIYKISDGNSYAEGAAPGWDVVDGRGFSTGWNTYGSASIPVDAMFSNWGGSFTVSQAITDLPAGVYRLTAGYGERMNEDEAPNALEGTYLFAKTTESGDEPVTVECPRIGQAFPEMNLVLEEELVVTDGYMTIGVEAGNDSHVFFNEVKLEMIAKAAGFDYAAAYTTDIDQTEAKAQKVRAIQLFDLNGQRISNGRKGVYIVKKQMSDGTVRTEKVIKK